MSSDCLAHKKQMVKNIFEKLYLFICYTMSSVVDTRTKLLKQFNDIQLYV